MLTSSEIQQIQTLLTLALEEDRVEQDATSQAIFSASDSMSAHITAREEMVFAGAEVLPILLSTNPLLKSRGDLDLTLHVTDGQKLGAGEIIATSSGPTIELLSLERTILNLLQRICGVATLTRKYVDKVAGTGVTILDTRKTIPGWRVLDKYAVRCGGGQNHRMHLADAIMLKDNHIAAVGGIEQAIQKVLSNHPSLPIIVECDTLEQVKAMLNSSPLGGEQLRSNPKGDDRNVGGKNKQNITPHDSPAIASDLISSAPPQGGSVSRILLDNMPPATLKQAVELVSGNIPLEASGGVNLDTVRAIAESGVDYISVGALTHSAVAVDIGLDD